MDAAPDGPANQRVRLVEVQPFRPTFMRDRKSTRLNSSHTVISYAVFCLKKKKNRTETATLAIQNNELVSLADKHALPQSTRTASDTTCQDERRLLRHRDSSMILLLHRHA